MGSLLTKKKNRKKTKEKPKSPQKEKKEIKIPLNSIKLGLLGDSQVGKTSICNSILGYDFGELETTIGANKIEKKHRLNNGKEVKIILWDTAGQERFRSAVFITVKNADGIILVFDVTNKNSFDNLGTWLPEIKERCSRKPVTILFGNKVDIGEDRREVSREEIDTFVKVNNLLYFEISAKKRTGIDDGVSYLANAIYNKYVEN